MTSVNESNAYQRGKREGYDIGYASAMDNARKHGLSLRIWKLVIAGVAGFMLAVALEAHGMSMETAHTTAQIVENESLLSRIWGAILKVLM